MEPSEDFCVRLVETTGVMFTPGSALDMEGYVRIGYANSRSVLDKGLALVSTFLRTS
jgi:aspartate/methionine/tyrosine aminotransferase